MCLGIMTSISDHVRQTLKQGAHANLTEQEEKKMIITYLMFVKMVGQDDEKTLDLLQKAIPIFCFTQAGQTKVAQIFIKFLKEKSGEFLEFFKWDDGLKHLQANDPKRKELSACILNLCREIDNL